MAHIIIILHGINASCICECTVKRNNSPLSAACFTFVRESIYHEPSEVVRMAGVPNIAGRHRHTKSRTAPDIRIIKALTDASSTVVELTARIDSSKTETSLSSADDHQNKLQSRPPPGQ